MGVPAHHFLDAARTLAARRPSVVRNRAKWWARTPTLPGASVRGHGLDEAARVGPELAHHPEVVGVLELDRRQAAVVDPGEPGRGTGHEERRMRGHDHLGDP